VNGHTVLHLIEPRADGHRMQYVRRLVERTPPAWSIVLSTFESSLQHPGTLAAAASGGQRLQLVAMAGEAEFEARVGGADGFKLQPAYWSLFRRHFKRLQTRVHEPPAQLLVTVPYLDYISYAVGAFGSPFGRAPFSGIVMRPDFHWPEQGVVAPTPRQRRLKRWLFGRLLAQPRLQRLVSIDPSLRDWVAQHQPVGHQKLRYAADPADLQGDGDRAAARAHFGLDPQTTVVLLFGSIDLRKGVARLLDAAAGPAWPATVQLLLAGRQSPEVRALLAARAASLPAGRVVQVDRYLDRQDEWLAFAAADLCWVAYEGFFGPSGVLAQCVQAGLPMIHQPQGLIGYQLARGGQPVQVPWLHTLGLSVARLAPASGCGPGGLEPGIEQAIAP
jgi:hypothetical protein